MKEKHDTVWLEVENNLALALSMCHIVRKLDRNTVDKKRLGKNFDSTYKRSPHTVHAHTYNLYEYNRLEWMSEIVLMF